MLPVVIRKKKILHRVTELRNWRANTLETMHKHFSGTQEHVVEWEEVKILLCPLSPLDITSAPVWYIVLVCLILTSVLKSLVDWERTSDKDFQSVF